MRGRLVGEIVIRLQFGHQPTDLAQESSCKSRQAPSILLPALRIYSTCSVRLHCCARTFDRVMGIRFVLNGAGIPSSC